MANRKTKRLSFINLVDREFHTNRVDLFAERFGELLNLSREGR